MNTINGGEGEILAANDRQNEIEHQDAKERRRKHILLRARIKDGKPDLLFYNGCAVRGKIRWERRRV